MINFRQRSIDIILQNQHHTGSYVSCPNYERYKNCWVRDGSYIAYAMDVAGYHDSSNRYFDWTNAIIMKYSNKIAKIIYRTKENKVLLNSDYLSQRYTLDGEEVDDEWPNFQLDGFGVWLWSMCKHIQITNDSTLYLKYNVSINLITQYLLNLWNKPCYDCWEEKENNIHTSTLACIYGGLKEVNRFIEDKDIENVINDIRKFILKNSVKNNRLTKYVNSSDVDGSLLWAVVPFNVFNIEEDVIHNTVKDIEMQLLMDGGVYRYKGDVYYGGGQWLILSCWLGWYYTLKGEKTKAINQIKWVESNIDNMGYIPEQNLDKVMDTDYKDKWNELWGEVASPSLWAHAMYIVLCEALNNS